MRAFAIDLDGTLLGSDGEMGARNARALRAARHGGYEIILATARWYQLALPVAEALGISGPVIACQGAQVRRLADSADLWDVRLPADFCRELFEICDAERCIAWISLDEEVIAKAEGELDAMRAVRQVASLGAAARGDARVALIQGTHVCREIRARLAPRWCEQVRFVTSVSSYGKPILTLTSAQANKGLALSRACDALGLAPREVIAFGDAENDLELFAAAGYSFAMGQADSAVKRAASAVTASQDDAGVAVAVERLLREGDGFLERAAKRAPMET